MSLDVSSGSAFYTSVWENYNETKMLIKWSFQNMMDSDSLSSLSKDFGAKWYLSSLFSVSERLSQHFDFAAAEEKDPATSSKLTSR